MRGADPDGVPPTSAPVYGPPVKRSVTIAGHQTAISLEPLFWSALREAAAADGLPVNALIARIDVERIAIDDPPNLTSAIRCWLYVRAIAANCDNVTNGSQ
ncbi:ribbon-helix-helix domain-containing protein [Sphingobium aromaticiconvertens]|uniref:ribbon-helix-helix domain-containing protein n=1 Tax=Sphingobium aromaticiconvertens TaxID=365341 RepID=UPI0030186BE1